MPNKDYTHAYYLAHREHLLAQSAEYVRTHREHRREYAKIWNRGWGYRNKTKALAHYSNNDIPQCATCGITDVDVLCIDHINGGGTAHRRAIGIPSGSRFYRWLISKNFPLGYQTLCANCNLKKRIMERE